MSKKNTTKEATELIANAMRDALRTIASEAKDAKHVVATDAETAAKLLVVQNPGIENGKENVKVAVLETQMIGVVDGLKVLGCKIDTLTIKIDDNYVKKEDFNPVRDTVDSLKLWQAKVLGIAVAVAFVVEYVFRLIYKN
jgi:hypothetical protein